MAERGAGLSSRASIAPAASVSDKTTAPAARWGSTIRSVLLSPRRGFRRAFEIDRASPGGRVRAVLVAVPAAFGGAFVLLASLKVRSVTDLNPISASDFRWDGFAGALAIGALAGVLGHYLFGAVAGQILRRQYERCRPRDLRLIWVLAAMPVAVAFPVILLLDVLIAGREAYAPIEDDTLTTAWTAGSIVLSVALATWSAYLFTRGLRVATGMSARGSIMVGVVAVICVLVAAPAAVLLMIGVVTLVDLLVELVQAVSK